MTQKKLSEKELLNLVEQLGKDPSMKFTDLESDVQEQLLDLQKNASEANPILLITEPKQPGEK